jgi:hypothetical protein
MFTNRRWVNLNIITILKQSKTLGKLIKSDLPQIRYATYSKKSTSHIYIPTIVMTRFFIFLYKHKRVIIVVVHVSLSQHMAHVP